jgi:hypothetical protein
LLIVPQYLVLLYFGQFTARLQLLKNHNN